MKQFEMARGFLIVQYCIFIKIFHFFLSNFRKFSGVIHFIQIFKCTDMYFISYDFLNLYYICGYLSLLFPNIVWNVILFPPSFASFLILLFPLPSKLADFFKPFHFLCFSFFMTNSSLIF